MTSLLVRAFRRSSPFMRLATQGLIAIQMLTAAPVLAQGATRAAAASSSRAAGLAQDATKAVAAKTSRAAADVQRKLAKARVRVNKTVPRVTAPSLDVAFGIHVTTEMVTRTRAFLEPLAPTSEPTLDDNRAVARMLQTVATARPEIRLVQIDAYLRDQLSSPWRASLLANAGTVYAAAGYFSRAASYWDQAWDLTRDSTAIGSRAIADYALGESLQQMIGFGQLDRAERRLQEASGRDVRGGAATKVSSAREGLALLRTHHDMATFSGPEALKMFLTVAPTPTLEQSLQTINAYHPTMDGTNLIDLRNLARSAGLPLDMIYADPLGDIPVPSIVHLRSEHYSAVIREEHGTFILRDNSLGGTFVMTGAALREEASGYFLVSSGKRASMPARIVADDEAGLVLGHCTPGMPATNDPPTLSCGGGRVGGGGPGPSGMPCYSFHPNKASLLIDDVPLGYTSPLGPSINVQLTYDSREGRQGQTFDYGHVGRMWSSNWLSYVTDNLAQMQAPYTTEIVTLRSIGQELYTTNAPYAEPFHKLSRAVLVKVAHDPVRFERQLPDGTVEVFAFPDRGATQGGRRTFLTEIVDPQGHSVHLTYDSSLRLVALTDAIDQVTTLEYLDGADPLRLTRITDPFGRVATLSYDGEGHLAVVTDVAGMTSRFSYATGDFIASMTTPYGTTAFRRETNVLSNRFIEATDPAGGTERLEFHFQNDNIPITAAATEVPTGFSASNDFLHRYNTLYWDKQAMAAGAGSLSTATITNWMLAWDLNSGHGWSRNVPHSVKRPLESRVWYRYPDQSATAHHNHGSGTAPSLVGRVLDGGASQVTQFTYNTKGRVLSRIDPLGRQTNYTYGTNGLDLLQVEQVRNGGTDVLQTYAGYNSQHLPGTVTDASGQTTTMTYNAAGQPLTVTNAKSETTTFTYDGVTGHVFTVTGPVSGSTTTFTYDAYGRVESVEDGEGHVVVTDYDVLNRLTQRTYPDDTAETLTYSRLDLTEEKDRIGRITRHFYDGFGRRTATRDPAGRTISQVWCDCGSMETLVDANGNRTNWERDVQGRVTREVRADNTTDTLYTYDLAGRQKTVTDPKDQVTTHTYNIDGSLAGTSFTNEVINTPNVSYTYDSYYARDATMVDGTGTTTYTYKSPGTNGAGQVASVDGPLSNDTITYTYDELGRIIDRAINGAANTVTSAFDALGRITSEANVLGTFTYTYDGAAARIATVSYPNGQTSAYSYLPTAQDHRLQTIHHKYANASTLSKSDYTYDAVGNILTWRQQADTTTVLWKYGYDKAEQLIAAVKESTDATPAILARYAYSFDSAGNRTVEQIDDEVSLSALDTLNRLTSQGPGGPMVISGSLNEPGTVTISGVPLTLDASNAFRGTVPTTTGTNAFTVVAKDATGNTSTQTYEVDVAGSAKTFTYDANGNLTSDGARTFEWDAENRLVAVNIGTHRSEFTYDGFGRRVRIVEKENGATARDAQLFWDGTEIIEERLTTGAVNRFFDDAEQHNGVARYLTRDHLGSIREVTDTTGAVTTRNDYDPYGRLTRVGGSEHSRFGYTGHMAHNPSGLALALYRAYDPILARWLNEDPAGMPDGPNRFSYVLNRPISAYDPDGRFLLVFALPAVVEAAGLVAAYTLATLAGLAIGEKLSDALLSKKAKENEKENEKAFDRDENKPRAKKNKYPAPDENTYEDFSRTKDLMKRKSGRDPYGDINKSKKPKLPAGDPSGIAPMTPPKKSCP